MQHILMTGGTGFVGEWMRRTAYLDMVIHPLDELQYRYGDWYKHCWDGIVHLAPVTPERVIECARRNNAPILYSSSGAVYDPYPGAYSLMKQESEKMLLESGLTVKIARMFTFVGSHMKNHFAIINYIVDAISDSPIKIRGDNVTRSYMYALDMAKWMWAIYDAGKSGQLYEVGGLTPITMQELAEEVARRFNPRPKVIEDRIFADTNVRPYYVPTRADETRQELGLPNYTPFDVALSHTIAWYLERLSI